MTASVALPQAPADRATKRRGMRWQVEAVVALLLYAAYDLTRTLRGASGALADRHGETLLRWEHAAHLDPEHALNSWFAHTPIMSVAAGYYYGALHFLVTPAVLVWLYRRRPDHYRAARNTLVVATLIALVGYFAYPTAPPRLLPGGTFQDTMSQVHQWGWWGATTSAPSGLGNLANEFAAMRSLHVAWALWCGWFVARQARQGWLRALAVAYPVLTTLVVMGTGNHYLLDAAAGAGVVTAAALLSATGSRVARARTERSRLNDVA